MSRKEQTTGSTYRSTDPRQTDLIDYIEGRSPTPNVESTAGRPAVMIDPVRDALGRRVREVWIAWAMEQPSPKPSWLVPWEGLSEPDREVDRRIGETIAREAVERVQKACSEIDLGDLVASAMSLLLPKKSNDVADARAIVRWVLEHPDEANDIVATMPLKNGSTRVRALNAIRSIVEDHRERPALGRNSISQYRNVGPRVADVIAKAWRIAQLPDARCVTTGDGGCVAESCMHTDLVGGRPR